MRTLSGELPDSLLGELLGVEVGVVGEGGRLVPLSRSEKIQSIEERGERENPRTSLTVNFFPGAWGAEITAPPDEQKTKRLSLQLRAACMAARAPAEEVRREGRRE